jgi:hypothetical protein
MLLPETQKKNLLTKHFLRTSDAFHKLRRQEKVGR